MKVLRGIGDMDSIFAYWPNDVTEIPAIDLKKLAIKMYLTENDANLKNFCDRFAEKKLNY